jgi:hypothetical protein
MSHPVRRSCLIIAAPGLLRLGVEYGRGGRTAELCGIAGCPPSSLQPLK